MESYGCSANVNPNSVQHFFTSRPRTGTDGELAKDDAGSPDNCLSACMPREKTCASYQQSPKWGRQGTHHRWCVRGNKRDSRIRRPEAASAHQHGGKKVRTNDSQLAIATAMDVPSRCIHSSRLVPVGQWDAKGWSGISTSPVHPSQALFGFLSTLPCVASSRKPSRGLDESCVKEGKIIILCSIQLK